MNIVTLCVTHTHHFVLGKRASFVGQEILDSPQLLWDVAGPHDGARNGLVSLDHAAVDQLAHVKVDTQAGRGERGGREGGGRGGREGGGREGGRGGRGGEGGREGRVSQIYIVM